MGASSRELPPFPRSLPPLGKMRNKYIYSPPRAVIGLTDTRRAREKLPAFFFVLLFTQNVGTLPPYSNRTSTGGGRRQEGGKNTAFAFYTFFRFFYAYFLLFLSIFGFYRSFDYTPYITPKRSRVTLAAVEHGGFLHYKQGGGLADPKARRLSKKSM